MPRSRSLHEAHHEDHPCQPVTEHIAQLNVKNILTIVLVLHAEVSCAFDEPMIHCKFDD